MGIRPCGGRLPLFRKLVILFAPLFFRPRFQMVGRVVRVPRLAENTLGVESHFV